MRFLLIYLAVFNLFSLMTNLQATNWWDSFKANYAYQHQNYAQAAQKCEQLVLNDPANMQNLVNMGKVLYQQAQYAQASNYFKQVLDEHASALTSAQKQDLWFALGSSYASQEQWQPALDSYEQLLQIDAQNLRAQKNIEIIKKLLEQQKQDQEQKKPEQKQDPEKPEKSESNSEQSCDQNQSDQDSKQDQSANKQDQQGKQDKPKQTNSSHDRQASSSDQAQAQPEQSKQQQTSGQAQAQAKQAAQEQLQQALDAKLRDQDKQYLQSIEKNDQQANAYLAHKQAKALRGQEQKNENNW